MRERTPRVYDLDYNRVLELRYFCRQYRMKQALVAAIRGGVNGHRMDGMPGAPGRISNPTEASALRVIESRDARDVEMIEAAARWATDGSKAMTTVLLANVADGVPLGRLTVPTGINQYYKLRRRFFWRLDRLQNGDAGDVEP